jgi:hypothetical protein
MNRRAVLLTALQLMFLGRVVGQILVMAFAPGWLPAAQHWYSGFLPYSILLPAQIIILVIMTAHTVDAWRMRGRWYVTKENTKESLRMLAVFYAAAMMLRYVLTMIYIPEMRWFGHAIPIFFHFVLAGYVAALAWTPRRRRKPAKFSLSTVLATRSQVDGR